MDLKRSTILQAMITHTLKVVLLDFDLHPHFLSSLLPLPLFLGKYWMY